MSKHKLFSKMLAILLLGILTVLTACGGNGKKGDETTATSLSETDAMEVTTAESEVPNGLMLAENQKTEYTIVYPEGASSVIMQAVIALKDAFSENFGVSIFTKDDYLKKGETADGAAREILIGQTNRPATATVAETLERGDYTAVAIGNQLVLLGYTERGTVAAVTALIEMIGKRQTEWLCFTEDDTLRLHEETPVTISFFGDSITTYEGYSDSTAYNETLKGNLTWYTPSKLAVTSTWWHRTLSELDWELCVNNSYSGGRVTNAYSYDTRAINLHTNDGVKPDVIVIYFGINDYNNMVDITSFSTAYDTILRRMRESYPDAVIYCCTLIPIICTDNGRNTDLEKNGVGVTIATFNGVISNVAAVHGAEVIDFHATIGATLYQHTYDRIHPNADGMKMMSDVVVARLKQDFS